MTTKRKTTWTYSRRTYFIMIVFECCSVSLRSHDLRFCCFTKCCAGALVRIHYYPCTDARSRLQITTPSTLPLLIRVEMLQDNQQASRDVVSANSENKDSKRDTKCREMDDEAKEKQKLLQREASRVREEARARKLEEKAKSQRAQLVDALNELRAADGHASRKIPERPPPSPGDGGLQPGDRSDKPMTSCQVVTYFGREVYVQCLLLR